MSFDEEIFNICEECTKKDTCPNRNDKLEDCEDADEIKYGLTPLGVFCTVVSDMKWADMFANEVRLAWEVYEARSEAKILSKQIFSKVISDFDWASEGSKEIDIAFDLMCSRMKAHSLLVDDKKEETNGN